MIGILLYLVILFYIFKALTSTFVGILFIILGACCNTAAMFLRLIVVLMDLSEKYWPKKHQPKPLPRDRSIGELLALAYPQHSSK